MTFTPATDLTIPTRAAGDPDPSGDVNKIKAAVAELRGANLAVASDIVATLPKNAVTKTAAYTAAAGDFVLANATTAGFAVTLPTAPAVGALVTVKKTDSSANVVTVTPATGGTIDGDPNATIVAKNYGAVLEHVGSNVWQIVAPTTAAPGATGPTGTAATVAVGTVTTGAAGSSAAVTNSGTSTAATFNFTIPQGTTGSAGVGVPTGGTTGQVLAKSSNTDYATTWTTPSTGGGGTGGPSAGALARSGFYFTMPGNVGGNLNPGVGTMLAMPILIGANMTVDRIAVNVTAATTSAVWRLGIYADNGSMFPGAKILDAGTIDASGTGLKEIVISQALTAGFVWLVGVQQVAAASIGSTTTTPYPISASGPGNLENNITCIASQTSTTGALPATFGAGAGNLPAPRIALRAV